MSAAYAATDIVISRAGAMAVAEICITGKPCVFVPYPLAAEDHQTYNAMTLVNEGAALMVADNAVNEKLMSNINIFISSYFSFLHHFIYSFKQKFILIISRL